MPSIVYTKQKYCSFLTNQLFEEFELYKVYNPDEQADPDLFIHEVIDWLVENIKLCIMNINIQTSRTVSPYEYLTLVCEEFVGLWTFVFKHILDYKLDKHQYLVELNTRKHYIFDLLDIHRFIINNIREKLLEIGITLESTEQFIQLFSSHTDRYVQIYKSYTFSS